jgi:hypothetical protein
MNLVSENINEAIKHLSPRSEKEVNNNFDNEIKEWISSGLSGSKYLIDSISEYFDDNLDINNTCKAEIGDEIIITLFYNYLKKDEKKLAEAIKSAIENIKRNV